MYLFNSQGMHFTAGMVVIKMTLVSKSALCLVYLSSLVVGLPTSASDQDTEGPTKIELLVAGGSQRTDNVEATTVTAADSPGNNALRSQSEPFAAVGVLRQPCFTC
jgi:hypothetical protein